MKSLGPPGQANSRCLIDVNYNYYSRRKGEKKREMCYIYSISYTSIYLFKVTLICFLNMKL